MSERELARLDGGRLVLRPAPLRVRWELADLVSADGHRLRCAFGCGVRAVDRLADQKMLEEALLDGRDAVTAETVIAHLAPALRAAADRAVAARAGEAWLDADASRELGDVIKRAGDAVAFACGLELLAPVEVDLHSPTLERQRLETMERQLAERRAAGQVEHFQRAASLLSEFEQLRQATPALSAGRLLERVNAADRGSMLEALLMASGDDDAAAAMLYAVAGPHLVRLDPRTDTPRPELIELPQDLGPFRSVQRTVNDAGERRLLLGARSGFIALDPVDPASAALARDDAAATSALGFNRIVFWSESAGFVGTHGEAGVVRWDVAAPASPSARYSITGPRNLTRLDAATLAFSVGPELYFMSTEAAPQPHALPAGAAIAGIELSDRWLHIVREDGTIQALDRVTRELARTERRCGRVTAVGTLPWLGDVRLLLASEDGPICCVGGDDPLVTQYVSRHRGLKAIAAGGGYVAGVTGDRQRIVVWHAWDGSRPIAEIHVGGVARHRVADVSFA